MNPSPPPYPRVLLRSEASEGRIAVIVSLMPAGAGGPPLHKHDFDEAFYVLDGTLTFQVEEGLLTARAGASMFARRAARAAGIDPPDWALKDIPPVTIVGPQH